MEWKMCETCLDTVLASLEEREKYDCYEYLKSPVEMMKIKLKILKLFFWGLTCWEDMEYDWHLRCAINTSKFSQTIGEFEAECKGIVNSGDVWLDLEAVMYNMEKTIDEQLTPRARDVCIVLLGGANYKCKPCPPNQKAFVKYGRDTASFVDLIRHNLKAILNSNLIAPVMKQQIILIREKLEAYGTFVDPVSLSITQVKKVYELLSSARTWFSHISCLAYLYWIDGKDESLASIMETRLSCLLHNAMPLTISGVISSHFQPTMIPQLLAGHLDSLLEDLVIPMKDELHEGLIFLLSFIVDPPEDDPEDGERICSQVLVLLNEFPSLVYSICFGEMEFHKANLSYFLLRIDAVRGKVRKFYLMSPYSSQCTSPSTNILGFLDSMIGNLNKLLEGNVSLIVCLKRQVELVQKELASLRPLLKNIMGLPHDEKHKEIQSLRNEIMDMIYNADYFIKLSHLRSFSASYGIIGLPDALKHIKQAKIQMNNLVGVEKMDYKKELSHHDQMEGTTAAFRPRATTSEIEMFTVGFIKDQREIIEELTGGSNALTIISISGSGGQGKTTLAKRIYNDLNVKFRFQKTVWCYVSKDCPMEELLAQVLSSGEGGVANKLGRQELVEGAWKSLKGKRYLIVLDDIWDVDAWRKLEFSFPDDKNGSRILFTSRNDDVAFKAKSNSIRHRLQFFSEEESWELMKKKVFDADECDEQFEWIGKKIASYCNGLPLAVVLSAAVLRRFKSSLDSWYRVAQNFKAHLNEGGCGNIIEESFNFLPDHLKSCFLYFGAFGRGENVRAKELKLLWIGEGLVMQKGELQSSEDDLATEYLENLVSQGLVVVTERGSTGGIKRCSVHDLIYDLCLEKCKEDNFLSSAEESRVVMWDAWDDECNIHCIGPKYNHHRVRIGESDYFVKPNSIVSTKELPASPLHSFLWLNKSDVGKKSRVHFMESFKLLTVLKLRVMNDVDDFPGEILSIIYLRYLELYFRNPITSIPSAITNLWKLETLIIDLVYGGRIWLPVCIRDMKSLIHVHVSCARFNLKEFDQKNQAKSNIATFATLNMEDDDRASADLLRHFPNLRKLKCHNNESERHIVKLLSMVGSQLKQLESLKVCHRPYSDLYPYNLNANPVLNFPVIENLNRLSLHETRIPWRVVTEIGKQLLNLQVLKLLSYSCVGRIWRLEDGDFPNLVYLQLSSLPDIREIDVSSCEDNPPFPYLEHLVLKKCIKLGDISSVFEEIDTLKTIKVAWCSTEIETAAVRILEQQREFGNDGLLVTVES